MNFLYSLHRYRAKVYSNCKEEISDNKSLEPLNNYEPKLMMKNLNVYGGCIYDRKYIYLNMDAIFHMT